MALIRKPILPTQSVAWQRGSRSAGSATFFPGTGKVPRPNSPLKPPQCLTDAYVQPLVAENAPDELLTKTSRATQVPPTSLQNRSQRQDHKEFAPCKRSILLPRFKGKRKYGPTLALSYGLESESDRLWFPATTEGPAAIRSLVAGGAKSALYLSELPPLHREVMMATGNGPWAAAAAVGFDYSLCVLGQNLQDELQKTATH